ncbi:MAG: hypothetical protein NW200_10655 [Hyphomonadaceae bacterium]|nr:hypothetical protein [Hyphomonadaceae bacterium]
MIGGGFVFVYAVLAVAFAGSAIYLMVARGAPVSSPQVLVSGLGALWFSARTALALAKKG